MPGPHQAPVPARRGAASCGLTAGPRGLAFLAGHVRAGSWGLSELPGPLPQTPGWPDLALYGCRETGGDSSRSPAWPRRTGLHDREHSDAAASGPRAPTVARASSVLPVPRKAGVAASPWPLTKSPRTAPDKQKTCPRDAVLSPSPGRWAVEAPEPRRGPQVIHRLAIIGYLGSFQLAVL